MKGKVYIILSLIILLSSCNTNNDVQKSEPTPIVSTSNEKQNNMKLEDDFVLGRGSFDEDKSIEVVMRTGSFSYDRLANRRQYTGIFYIQYYQQDQLISESKLDNIAGGTIRFHSFFDIKIQDYNADGNFEFLIGSAAGSNGCRYNMYTITENDEIKRLKVGEYDYIYAANSTSSYALTEEGNGIWSYKQYDQEKGYMKITLKWDGEKFIETARQQE